MGIQIESKKYFLPIEIDQHVQKVRLVACATPASAIDFIKRFVEEYKKELEERKAKLASGGKKDAFLIILTPDTKIDFYGESKKEIHQIIADYRDETEVFSEDYYKMLNYYWLAEHPLNNLALRKIFFYEDYSTKQVHELIIEATQNTQYLCDINADDVKKVLIKCSEIKNIIDSDIPINEKN